MTTFISYSRINSDFTVRLAKDLRNAGYDIWLDQLDIPTGARWDDEIERALEACTTFLIVLSPGSIQSQNVKDEIGYAIDTGKQILPVVLENCKVPFRLRRFQYVDFTDQPYDESLAKIKFLLSNIKDLQTSPVDVIEEQASRDKVQSEPIEPKVSQIPVPQPISDGKRSLEGGKSARKWMPQIALGVFGVAVIILALIFKGGFGKSTPTQSDDASLNPISSPLPALTSVPVLPTETPTSQPPSDTPTSPPVDTVTSTALPDEIVDEMGIPMRLVQAGEFKMGSNGNEPDEEPSHTVYLDSFYMDKYEVTNVSYSACVSAGTCVLPKQTNSFRNANYFGNAQFDNYPVIYVDWFMAKTYCEWRQARLPTEAEWEKAARGPNSTTYPWGEGIDCTRENYGGCGRDTNVVGSYESGKSFYGLYDMAGNVWEWVADWYSADYYKNSPAANPLGPSAGTQRVMRGGSWADLGSSSRSANRHSNDPLSYGNSVGFRCVRDVPH